LIAKSKEQRSRGKEQGVWRRGEREKRRRGEREKGRKGRGEGEAKLLNVTG